MITLNDYLYSGDKVLKILQKYTRDLRKEAKLTHNEIDMMHVNFLIQITELLEHNDFLTAQSQKIREFYKYMAHEYPFLAFTFKGRIKSLIRAEEKFNGYIVEYIYDLFAKYGLMGIHSGLYIGIGECAFYIVACIILFVISSVLAEKKLSV